jgi:hypothetical protein
VRPYFKIYTQHKKGARGVAQVVECPPSKHEALSSNPSTAKKKKKDSKRMKSLNVKKENYKILRQGKDVSHWICQWF